MESNELFYLDDEGKKQDAALHAELLAQDPGPAYLQATIERAVALGIDRKVAERVYKRNVLEVPK